MSEIDWEALGEVEDMSHAYRVALAADPRKPGLSEVYVPGEGGNPVAFIIGEAPGGQEEIKRRPFVGKAGKVMRDLMAIAGLYSEVTYIGDNRNGVAKVPNCWLTNTVKFRPPRNRKPFPWEITAARPALRLEWEAVGKPRLIIPVGGTALAAITGKPQSILIAAGKCHRYRSREGRELFIWPMVHPSYGLRGGPQVQEMLEQDWENLATWRANEFG